MRNDIPEVVEPVIFEGVGDFKDRSNANKQYFYAANGNLTKDLNKGIDTIQHNLLNLPKEIVFANGDRSLYKYNAAGKKYQVIYCTHIDNELNPIQGNGVAMYDTLTYDYDGGYVYRDHYFNMLMTPDGYVHISDITPENCFYAKDHLGNNRATYYVTPMTELGVPVKDINNYYPYGMEFNEKPAVVNAGFNPELDFTYNGKEFQTMHGLNMLDYGARFIDMAKPDWIGVDPLAEKYYSISPYAYCAGNPVKYVDHDGRKRMKFSWNFSLSSGYVGAAAKLFGVGAGFVSAPWGGVKQEISIYFCWDTDKKKVGVGVSHTSTDSKISNEGNLIVNGSYSKEKKTTMDANTIDGPSTKKDASYVENETAGVGPIKNVSNNENETTVEASTSLTVNALMVGVEAKQSFTIEPEPKSEKEPQVQPVLKQDKKNKFTDN